MILDGGRGHLTYCTNIHPGETWAEVRCNLEQHLPPVRTRLASDVRFGVGLRLSAEAARALAEPAVLAEFKDFLARGRFYVFTLNAFPYGTFHGKRVKEDVYLPDWKDRRRLDYTNLMADLLAELLPPDGGLEGSVSTVPGAFKPNARTNDTIAAMADLMIQHVGHLIDLERHTGKHIALALEPEPCCFLETVEESIAFFHDYLFTRAAASRLSELTGIDSSRAERALRAHLGVCLDLCHAAVEFEDPKGCVKQLRDAGIGIYKMQITAGLRLPELSKAALAGVRQFDDPVYLHQVVESGPDGLTRYVDLPDALRSAEGRTLSGREWRVHCHVPVFVDELDTFSSTQSFVRDVLGLHRKTPVSTHLEVETYTWNVLPEKLRAEGMDHAIARELAWVRDELKQ